ncbi:tyrosine-type recombinase/integrase [Bacteroides reticulotermitis]|uniref:Mobile element protein n=2 Tax=Bacteroides reticulotermitis TaxID=1133319 RepID=W4V088_9BACE|nr:tyrosine-type recombinase/integrase [Bacteroides reticulotermitis]MBB4046474.1 site-specific recombinase XerD [Bacteroides reticulotermitis]GAE86641.1 mobile element protein [Bacteroides reticulotermitis JCM 10512]
MKNPTDFAYHLAHYFNDFLCGCRNLSKNTVSSYSDTFRLMVIFFNERLSIPPEKLTLKIIDDRSIFHYLEWLQTDRHCSNATRNNRLAAIHSFFRYLQTQDPKRLLVCQKILLIPFKKETKPILKYLTIEQISALLRVPNLHNERERRDVVLLSLLYDTGARVQEICDLRIRDIRLESPSIVTLTGKGRKTREIPIVGNTINLLSGYIKEKKLTGVHLLDHPLFFNQRRQPLSRGGITHILNKYASKVDGILIPEKITPHILRHSKAMHLLQGGYNMVIIRDWLGHVSIQTTEIYARLDIETKRKILESAFPERISNEEMPDWNEDKSLIDFLKNL